ncbi:MAG: hypothetical protein LBQ58_11665 [Synergistaceae bacterium]|nr:hypothetical protein [Synergistaceae bacterium]
MNGSIVIIIIGVSALAMIVSIVAWFFVSKRHAKLDKIRHSHVKIIFKKRQLPAEQPEPLLSMPICVIKAQKFPVWAAVVTWVLWVSLSLHMIYSGHMEYVAILIGSLSMSFYSLSLATRSITAYENAIVYHRFFLPEKIFYLNEIDCLASSDIIDVFKNKRAFGYHIVKDGKSICMFDSRSYSELFSLENAYTNMSPNVESVEYCNYWCM